MLAQKTSQDRLKGHCRSHLTLARPTKVMLTVIPEAGVSLSPAFHHTSIRGHELEQWFSACSIYGCPSHHTPTGNIWPYSKTFRLSQWGGSTEERPGMLLNILPHPGQLSKTKKSLSKMTTNTRGSGSVYLWCHGFSGRSVQYQ